MDHEERAKAIYDDWIKRGHSYDTFIAVVAAALAEAEKRGEKNCNHWFVEANAEHNRNEKLQIEKQSAEAERDYFQSEVAALREAIKEQDNRIAIQSGQIETLTLERDYRPRMDEHEKAIAIARVEGLREAKAKACVDCAARVERQIAALERGKGD